MRAILYLIQKEFRQVFRDKAMLFILFFAPLVQMIVLGYAITIDIKNVKTAIVDYDRSQASREVARRFQNNPYFEVQGYLEHPLQVREALDDWRTQLAVVIPRHFARDLQRGRRPQVQLIVDGVDGNAAGIILGYAGGILGNYAGETSEQMAPPAGFVPNAAAVVPEARMWYNLNLESKHYMVPGLIAVLLTLISMFLTSMALVREKEVGTLEQLMVTPVKTWQLMLGKVLPFLILAFLELQLMLVLAFVVFDLSMVGSLALLFGLAALYLLSTLGLGIFISTLAQTQQQAMFISWFFMIFLIFMSGFLFPIENMPPLIQKLTYADPMRYFMTAVREIFLKGTTAAFLLREMAVLSGMGVCILGLSAVKFRKRVS